MLPFNDHVEEVLAPLQGFVGLLDRVVQSAVIADLDQAVLHFESDPLGDTPRFNLLIVVIHVITM